MKNQDIKIDLGPVQETLMLPLWARARETEKDNPIVCDTYAKLKFNSRLAFLAFIQP
jgi:O-methyltransferase involved in polyketide biosynthesis